jgi:hypothetical protein
MDVPLDYDFVEGSMHAAWFHDAGMALDPGPVHGELGAELYLDFLRRSGEGAPALQSEILEAIGQHDDKQRVEEAVFRSGERPDLLVLLSVADDLDALGLCGIYRYAEIYLMRGVALEDLGERILDNAALRCRNLLHTCGNMPRIRQRIHTAYAELQSFYTGDNRQQLACIREMSLEARMDPADFVHLLSGRGAGEALLAWFKKLTHALENPEL